MSLIHRDWTLGEAERGAQGGEMQRREVEMNRLINNGAGESKKERGAKNQPPNSLERRKIISCWPFMPSLSDQQPVASAGHLVCA